ncbi:MAG: HAD-IIIA family hydrolase [Clostridium sp.]|jgi:3-deoxy-D-manno-octulosonate 8-phosphate phosphatase (KDO 8-P phosphatase)|nr:HAD-IIIA family hydrolase [Clostridium sp.]
MESIKMLVMDVDGTLTDGTIYLSAEGETVKGFHVKDGYAIARLSRKGILTAVLTGRRSQIVARRAEELGIAVVRQGIADKAAELSAIAAEYQLALTQIAYIGDDLNDLGCMKLCGATGAPADAADEIKETADFVSTKEGGRGAVREFVDWLLCRDRQT